MRCYGGEAPATASLAPKIGPLGLSPKKVADDIVKATAKDYKGIRVTCKLTIQNRQARVDVVPSASSLIIKVDCWFSLLIIMLWICYSLQVSGGRSDTAKICCEQKTADFSIQSRLGRMKKISCLCSDFNEIFKTRNGSKLKWLKNSRKNIGTLGCEEACSWHS